MTLSRADLRRLADEEAPGRRLFLIVVTPELLDSLLDLPLADGARVELVSATEVPLHVWSAFDVPVAEVTLRVVSGERTAEVANTR